MKFLVKIYLTLFGRKVGSDKYKNNYYEVSFKKSKKTKRFIIYNGLNEGSKVPPEWEAWLRFYTKSCIDSNYDKKAGYLPNLTGTIYAYNYVKNMTTKKVKSASSWQGK